MSVQVKAAGHLRNKMPEKRTQMSVDVNAGEIVLDVITRLGINRAQVWIIRLNGENVQDSHPVGDGDMVELFPLVGGG
jgi:sulfur carrier protein ThiS